MNYNVNLYKWLLLVLSNRFKKPNKLIWYNSILAPFKSLLNEFETFRKENDYKTQYSFEKLSIQTLLNELFDPMLMRIRIVTNTDLQVLRYYPRNTNQPVKHYNQSGLFYPKKLGSYNFIVFIPEAINNEATKAKITSWVNYYKFEGLSFTIKTI